uniref:Chromo domain-containing protein n=1 Tax=Naja naja TaxID=35670 RepID=A0A8C6XP46_NAJNA
MDHEYEVDSIRDSRQLWGRFQYLVAWKGYGPEDFTWIEATDVHAPHLVQDFHAQFPQHPHPKRRNSQRSGSVAPEVVEEAGEGQRPAEQSEEDPGPSPIYPRSLGSCVVTDVEANLVLSSKGVYLCWHSVH